MVKSELVKIWLKRYGWVYLLLILTIQICLAFTRYDAAYLNFDMEKEKTYFQQYAEEYSQMSAEEAYEAVLVETARLNHVSETAASALQKYENGEISERTFIEAIEAELTARHQRTAHNAIHEQVKRMHAGKPQVVQYTNGWSVLLNNHSSTLFLLLLLGLLITPVIPAEYRTEMLPFLFTTKKGKNNLFASKLIAVLLSAIGSLLMIELSELVCIAVRYGLPNGLFPVQSVQQFEDCPWNLTALNAYAVRLLLRVLGVCYLSILLYILTIWMKRTVPALIAGFGITLLPLGVFGETKKIFTLPIPLGLLRAAEYLQGKCTIRQTQIELTRGEILFAVLLCYRFAACFRFTCVEKKLYLFYCAYR